MLYTCQILIMLAGECGINVRYLIMLASEPDINKETTLTLGTSFVMH
jgi:hypothetical protein